MDNYIKIFADGIFDRLEEDDARVDTEAVGVSPDGSFAVYRLSLDETGDDSLIEFATDFAETHYPNEFNIPSATRVQVVLRQVMARQYPNVSMSVGAVFYTDEQDNPVIGIRLFDFEYYMGDGNSFRTPDLRQLVDFITQYNSVDRNIPEFEAGEQ